MTPGEVRRTGDMKNQRTDGAGGLVSCRISKSGPVLRLFFPKVYGCFFVFVGMRGLLLHRAQTSRSGTALHNLDCWIVAMLHHILCFVLQNQ